MKIFFFDHAFHKKTASSQFFVELLSASFEVEQIFFEPGTDTSWVGTSAIGQNDTVLLWQMDFLAPLFLARGLKVVVIPMFDGSSGAPDLHWLFARKAVFINFSLTLHNRVEEMGGISTLVRYYPEAAPAPCIDKDEDVRVFFWCRRPEDGIDFDLVDRLVGGEAASIHIHDAPDDPSQVHRPLTASKRRNYRLTRSTWFEREADYLTALSQANVFLAPRNGEGIGMAMVDALARGMVVIASDVPTHNEYIADGINGVLYDLAEPHPIALKGRMRSLSDMAWRAARFGRETWLASVPKLLSLFEELAPNQVTMTQAEVDILAPRLIRAYYSGMEAYSQFLREITPIVSRVSGLSLIDRISTSGKYDDRSSLDPLSARLRGLPQNRLPILKAQTFVLAGQLIGQDDGAWIVGEGVTIGFAMDPRFGSAQNNHLRLRRHGLVYEDIGYSVVLNGRHVASGNFSADQDVVEIAIDAADLKFQNYLQIQSQGINWGVISQCKSRLAVTALVFST
ncbi:glycosyltransferase [Brevundimonas sp.]|uniref:glycosyltransferase n=1 Tax=Brevundimonas sp. TaxID=1871086 RepID=UPI00289EC4B6|nr:glycosyltransferase [Brevundimonas sp.]